MISQSGSRVPSSSLTCPPTEGARASTLSIPSSLTALKSDLQPWVGALGRLRLSTTTRTATPPLPASCTSQSPLPVPLHRYHLENNLSSLPTYDPRYLGRSDRLVPRLRRACSKNPKILQTSARTSRHGERLCLVFRCHQNLRKPKLHLSLPKPEMQSSRPH